jgi:hypothetical protein
MIALWILLGVFAYLFVGIVTVAVMVRTGIAHWEYDEPDDALFAVLFSVIWPFVWLCAFCLTGVKLVLKVIGKKKEKE